MSHSVHFSRTDGREPTRDTSSGLFNLRAPMALTFEFRRPQRVKFGLTCSTHPLLLILPRIWKDAGLRLEGSQILDTGESIELSFECTREIPIIVEDGETLLRCLPLDGCSLHLGR